MLPLVRGRFERAFFDVFSIPMFSQTDVFPPATGNMRISRNEPTNREFWKSSTVPSLPSSGLSPEVSEMPPQCATRGSLSSKRDHPYGSTIAWIRCSLSFSLLHSSIQWIRGVHSALGCASKQLILPIDLVSTEAKISPSSEHSVFFLH